MFASITSSIKNKENKFYLIADGNDTYLQLKLNPSPSDATHVDSGKSAHGFLGPQN
jgi:hypothetical protein